MVSGCAAIMKYIMFIFNLLVCISGLCLIGVGAYGQAENKKYVGFFTSDSLTLPILFIVVGVISAVAGFLGCCGAIRESRTMLFMYAIVVFIIVVVEIAGGAYAFSKKDELKESVKEKIFRSMLNYYDEKDTSGAKTLWDLTQTKMDCCGAANNYKDWLFFKTIESHKIKLSDNAVQIMLANPENFYKSGFLNSIVGAADVNKLSGLATVFTASGLGSDVELPQSCCTEGTSCKAITSQLKIRKQGCLQKMIEFFEKNLILIAGIAIAVAFIEIAGIIVACCIAHSIGKEYYKTGF